MTRWVRRVVNTPIRGHGATFAAVAIGLAMATTGLVLSAPDPVQRPMPKPDAPASASPTVAPAIDGPPAPAAVGTVEAARCARRFLAGYLAYLYGHGTVEDIDDATAALVGRFAARPPRVSPAARKRHPRIQRLVVATADQHGRRVTATIADGGVRFPIAVMIVGEPDGTPVVADLLEEQ